MAHIWRKLWINWIQRQLCLLSHRRYYFSIVLFKFRAVFELSVVVDRCYACWAIESTRIAMYIASLIQFKYTKYFLDLNGYLGGCAERTNLRLMHRRYKFKYPGLETTNFSLYVPCSVSVINMKLDFGAQFSTLQYWLYGRKNSYRSYRNGV